MYSFPLASRSHLQLCLLISYSRLRFQSTLTSTQLSKSRLEKEHGDRQSFEVKCRSSGSVQVDIFHQNHLSDPLAPLVIYLPPTGTHLSHTHPPIPSYLLSGSTALARINYRWNIPQHHNSLSTSSNYKPRPDYHPFPIPVHDTLQAWSFITQTFLSSFLPAQTVVIPEPHSRISVPPSFLKESDPLKKRPIIIYGEFLGASIATSLALTEKFNPEICPSAYEIRLIAKQGVYDWVDIGTTAVRSYRASKHYQDKSQEPRWDKETLLGLRERLFVGPGGCLDVFASPTLLFRTPGIITPASWQDLTPKSSPFLHENEGQDFLEESEGDPNELVNVRGDSWAELLRLSKTSCSLSMCSTINFQPGTDLTEIPWSLFLYRNLDSHESRCGVSVDADISRSKLSIATPMRQARYVAKLLRESLSCTSEEMVQVRRLEGDLDEEAAVVKKWLEGITEPTKQEVPLFKLLNNLKID